MQQEIILITSVATILVLHFVTYLSGIRYYNNKISFLQSTMEKENKVFTVESISTLPPIVQKYFKNSIPENQKYLSSAMVYQRGQFRSRENHQWSRLKAKQYFTTKQPGFVWKAALSQTFIFRKTAVLSYIDKKGEGQLRFWGSIVLNEPKGNETTISMLVRYLTESVWFPTALLPSNSIHWVEHTDLTAKIVIRDGRNSASALVTFNEEGEIVQFETEDKFRDFKATFSNEKFTLRCSRYRTIDKIKVPTKVVFLWNLPSGDFPYAEIQVDDIIYT